MEESDRKLFLLLVVILSLAAFLLRCRRRARQKRLPPGPPGWPVFGNLFDLSSSPHISLAQLKQKYGPIAWLKLGSTNPMALLTCGVVAKFFKNHDLSFADRTITDTMRSHNYHKGSLALAPYGVYWRMLRRMCTVQMFVNKRISETAHIRQKCVNDLLKWIEKEAGMEKEARCAIHVSRFLFLASFNMLGNLILSRDLVDPESEMGSKFFIAISRIMDWSGRPNVKVCM